ncbi:MAG: DUF6873 family GME fold protein [Clostridiaceae bacterium]
MKNYAIVDFRIYKEEEDNLIKLGYDVIKCPPSSNLYDSVCGHPDMLIHFVDKKNVIFHKDMEYHFINLFKSLNFNVFLSDKSLETKYPNNIGLNAVNLKNYFIHNIPHTDSLLLSIIGNKKLLNVKQGYTKCSTAVINDNAIITSDTGIAKMAKGENIDVLLLPPGDISLPGLDYGFIGGCCGLLDKNRLAFFGDLNYYAYGKEILDFLYKYDIEPIYLRRGKLIDRGSLFVVES